MPWFSQWSELFLTWRWAQKRRTKKVMCWDCFKGFQHHPDHDAELWNLTPLECSGSFLTIRVSAYTPETTTRRRHGFICEMLAVESFSSSAGRPEATVPCCHFSVFLCTCECDIWSLSHCKHSSSQASKDKGNEWHVAVETEHSFRHNFAFDDTLFFFICEWDGVCCIMLELACFSNHIWCNTICL